jgi:hypothetical protein
MERDWEFSSKSIHEIRKSEAKWNGIRKFLQNRSPKSENLNENGTGSGNFFKIVPRSQINPVWLGILSY